MNTLLITCIKVIYTLSVKINISRLYKHFKGFFHSFMLLVLSIRCKIVKMLEKIKVCKRQVRRIWWMRQNFESQIIQFRLCCSYQTGCISCNFLCTSSNCWQYFKALIVSPDVVFSDPRQFMQNPFIHILFLSNFRQVSGNGRFGFSNILCKLKNWCSRFCPLQLPWECHHRFLPVCLMPSSLSSPCWNLWNHLCAVRTGTNPSPNASLMFIANSEAVLPSLY